MTADLTTAPQTFDSLDPATGQVLARHPVRTAADVQRAVAQAREAALWWRAQGWDGRRRHLRAWKGVLARGIAELADLVHRENGKPHADAVLRWPSPSTTSRGPRSTPRRCSAAGACPRG